jgi:hypothetical protein
VPFDVGNAAVKHHMMSCYTVHGMFHANRIQCLICALINCPHPSVVTFLCRLDPQQGCSRTLRAAHAQKGALQPPEPAAAALSSSPSCSYQLEVQTADMEGAGTSGSMFVQLGGVLGESEAVQLTANAGAGSGFATGQAAG